MSTTTLRNIGPKSAAWLRQVGLRSHEDLVAVGAVGAFVKVRRAGFKPSLNLLYSLQGALLTATGSRLTRPSALRWCRPTKRRSRSSRSSRRVLRQDPCAKSVSASAGGTTRHRSRP